MPLAAGKWCRSERLGGPTGRDDEEHGDGAAGARVEKLTGLGKLDQGGLNDQEHDGALEALEAPDTVDHEALVVDGAPGFRWLEAREERVALGRGMRRVRRPVRKGGRAEKCGKVGGALTACQSHGSTVRCHVYDRQYPTQRGKNMNDPSLGAIYLAPHKSHRLPSRANPPRTDSRVFLFGVGAERFLAVVEHAVELGLKVAHDLGVAR